MYSFDGTTYFHPVVVWHRVIIKTAVDYVLRTPGRFTIGNCVEDFPSVMREKFFINIDLRNATKYKILEMRRLALALLTHERL